MLVTRILPSGNVFRFDIHGNAWDIREANKNGVYSKLAASDILNVGSSGLFNQQLLGPLLAPPAALPIDIGLSTDIGLPKAVPEPTTLPLFGFGLARQWHFLIKRDV